MALGVSSPWLQPRRRGGRRAPTYVVMLVVLALSRVITYKYLLSYLPSREIPSSGELRSLATRPTRPTGGRRTKWEKQFELPG